VLAHRFGEVPNLGDIKEIQADCVVAGFPCQDLSVAGRRTGLAGDRSGLFFDLMRLVAAARHR
jgi:DNA (cytosine-5)-methyltransferase 1